MAEEKMRELSAEEAAALAKVEQSQDALTALIGDLENGSRRRRQTSARVVALLAEREPSLLAPFIPQLIESLSRPEAQTRWEVLDALTLLTADNAKECGAAYEGAEAALFDEISAPLRFSAFRFLTVWGATERRRSEKVWPLLDEAIQCYHGDLEYRDMLALLFTFANGQISGSVAEELAGRLQFDAENGKGNYLKVRSREIYDVLAKRFKFDKPQKRARVAKKSDEDDEE